MITFFTLVLDGMPWITKHYPVFKSLDLEWQWIVLEGVAANKNCTSWCADIPPRLSQDGTHEYLQELYLEDRRITWITLPLWEGGKVQMCNRAAKMAGHGLLWEIDSDEVWTKQQIETVVRLFHQNPWFNCAMFRCRYFVGPDIITQGVDCYGNNTAYEWKRVWRWQPGLRFATHEPPKVNLTENVMPHETTQLRKCVFDHFAYATEAQVRFKQEYYAGAGNPLGHLYANAVEGWKRLQQNDKWPVKLKDYMPWVDDRAQAVRLT